MGTSPKKAAANRRNAQKSSGPKTPEGKSISSKNSTTHGFNGQFKVLPHEDQSAFDDLLRKYRAEFTPRNQHETFLVEQLAQSRWRLDRIRRFEGIAFEQLLLDGVDAPDFRNASGQNPDATIVVKLAARTNDPVAVLHRYAVAAERSYYRAHRELTQGRAREKRNEANEAQVWLKQQLQEIPLPPFPGFDDSSIAVPVSWSPQQSQSQPRPRTAFHSTGEKGGIRLP
jgi:hypothetical protein